MDIKDNEHNNYFKYIKDIWDVKNSRDIKYIKFIKYINHVEGNIYPALTNIYNNFEIDKFEFNEFQTEQKIIFINYFALNIPLNQPASTLKKTITINGLNNTKNAISAG